MPRRHRSILVLAALTLTMAPQTAHAADLGMTILWCFQLILFNPIDREEQRGGGVHD